MRERGGHGRGREQIGRCLFFFSPHPSQPCPSRSLPQLLAQAGPEACDADALQGASSSTRLLLGRRAALAEVGILSVRAVADGVARSAGAAQALAAALDAGPLGLPPPQGTEGEPRPEDGWLLARLAAGAEAAALKEARRAAAAAGVILRPPPPAVPPPSLHAPPPLVSGSVVPPPPPHQAPPATAYPPYALVKPPPPPPPPPPSTAYGRQ